MTDEIAEFVIYIINAIANAQSLYPSHVYKTSRGAVYFW